MTEEAVRSDLRCPYCGSRGVGRVGTAQYFCSDCCIEFAFTNSGTRLYWLDDEGELVAFEPARQQRPYGE